MSNECIEMLPPAIYDKKARHAVSQQPTIRRGHKAASPHPPTQPPCTPRFTLVPPAYPFIRSPYRPSTTLKEPGADCARESQISLSPPPVRLPVAVKDLTA
ncbi:hypothetical protein H6P81_009277 [Aristolochia fimbriata]|uniref:Uncharacterized protein n=1 Tax=Aristolochia fimbriata TaxID=158543 RepID=A0AAV7ENJ3_ARIFI|nr:hypothetical protein H6P81_009277 [Aristolochia fimbriata]